MEIDSIRWVGEITLIRSKDGIELEKRVVHNSVTNYALSQIVALIAYNAPRTSTGNFVCADYMQLGTGTPSDSGLGVPVSATFKQCAFVQPYLTYYLQYSTTWQTTDSATGTWTEVGLFDVNSNLWAYSNIGSLTVNSGEVLTVQWQIRFVGS